MNKFAGILVFIGCCVTGFYSCSTDAPDLGAINPLRVAVLPDQSPDRLSARYTPLLDYLAEELDTSVELIIPTDYQDLLDKFHNDEIDLARFGGFAFINAWQRDGAKALVMRDIDARFSSYFLVRADDPATKLADFRGKRLGFGSKLSTSGHLMPRYFLRNEDIIIEDYFASFTFSGAHDKTAYSVRDGITDLGVANALVIDQMYRDNLLSSGEVRILKKTPPYADYVWAVDNRVPETTRQKVQDAFLALSKNVPQQAKLLNQLGASYYLPASLDDFSSLQDISVQLGMLDDK